MSEIEEFKLRIVELEAEEECSYELIKRQADLLTRSVNLIKGDPPELTLWSHHDLPELIKDLLALQLENIPPGINLQPLEDGLPTEGRRPEH